MTGETTEDYRSDRKTKTKVLQQFSEFCPHAHLQELIFAVFVGFETKETRSKKPVHL